MSDNSVQIPKRILPIIVFSQFCCTSLWFAGNGVMNDLVTTFNLDSNALGHLTSFVQFGFISGTLVFALLSIADRYSPSKVFLFSAIIASFFNALVLWSGNSIYSLLVFRFATGFFLAGIYPVGMKIAADYYEKGLGKSLGYLVGALVLGTAFPHLLKAYSAELPWQFVLITTSSLAVLGGLLIAVFVPDGPYRKMSKKLDLKAIFKVFENKQFRSAAFGYFGHMWELYALWAFVPVILKTYLSYFPETQLDVSFWSFVIIGVGGISCVIGGYLSLAFGTKKIAMLSILFSGICCLLSPLLFQIESVFFLIPFLIFWGMVVIADSPLFSTLVAQNAWAENKGTALTIVNCIGFAITIVSIQLLGVLQEIGNPIYIYLILSAGPIFGLYSLLKQRSQAIG